MPPSVRVLPCLLLLGCQAPAARPEGTAFASAVTGSVARATDVAARASLHPIRPMTADAEVLHGDPDAPGKPFVIRIRELPGGIVPPHRHPVDEHVTVVEGEWWFATGEVFDRSKLTRMPAGSYAFVPAGTTMFGMAEGAAVVQVHGVGPFHIHWADGMKTLDDPGAEAAFRFRKGESVDTPRGRGRIRQGYASGALIQYEVEGSGGALWVAQQADVRNAAQP
jgi:quercetin dioxygenase-like cupin family protein